MSALDHRCGISRGKRSRRLLRRNAERGQMLVLVAFAMIGLAVATGLALDGGMLLLRKVQLNKAVDAAALAGVTKLNQGLDDANTQGQQIMSVNGIMTASPA